MVAQQGERDPKLWELSPILLLVALILVILYVVVTRPAEEEPLVSPRETMQQQVSSPPQEGEYQAALCLKTSIPVGDSILARGKVYGHFKTVQWYQDETDGRLVFSATKPDGTDYCTLLTFDFDPMLLSSRGVELDLSNVGQAALHLRDAVMVCTWHGSWSPDQDAEGNEIAPCTRVHSRNYDYKTYGVSLHEIEDPRFAHFTPVLVGLRKSGDPSLIPR